MPLSKYPSLMQDVSLKVASEVAYGALYDTVRESLLKNSDEIKTDISPVTIYQPENDRSTKTITLRIKATSFDRTLREDEVTSLVTTAAEAAKQQLGAELI